MRQWTVGGALIGGPDGLLLVQNRRKNGSFDWSPPGGVIEHNETILDGLTREVEEETGLRVTEWSGPAYVIEASAADLGWNLRVEAYVAVAYHGAINIDDPDGIVVDAQFVAHEIALGHTSTTQRWVHEPLSDWLGQRCELGELYRYRVIGADHHTAEVERW